MLVLSPIGGSERISSVKRDPHREHDKAIDLRTLVKATPALSQVQRENAMVAGALGASHDGDDGSLSTAAGYVVEWERLRPWCSTRTDDPHRGLVGWVLELQLRAESGDIVGDRTWKLSDHHNGHNELGHPQHVCESLRR